MELVNEHMSFKQHLLEFLTPVYKEVISVKKSRTAALVKLLVIVPTIFLLTLALLITFKSSAYNQQVSGLLLYIWLTFFVIYIISNLCILKINNPAFIRILTYLCVTLELATNQICLYATGSLTTHTIIFLVVCVCIYRIFFDYYISLFCAVVSSLFFITTVLLEFNRIAPISPFFSSPLKHQVYTTPALAFSFTFVVIMSVFITFFATNFSINQISKLNHYVIENWKSDLDSLHDYSKNITLAANIEDIINLTYKTIIQTTSYDMAAYMKVNGQNSLLLESSFGFKHEWIDYYNLNPLHMENSMIIRLLQQKKPIFVDDILQYNDIVHTFEEIPIKSLFIVPLISEDKLEGILLFSSTKTLVLSEHKMQMLIDITDQTTIVFQNLISLNRETKKASEDGLTGLYNRRYFDEQITNSISEAQNNITEVALIMVDVDNFKSYNDIYGHPEGDIVLKLVAETITKSVRSNDIVARYGGEEFIVILNNTDKPTALDIAERICSAVENIPVGILKRKITISLGVGIYPEHANDEIALIKHADKSLYFAKQSGRNQVCCNRVE